MQFIEYVFTITFVHVLNYPFEYPNYPNDFVVFGQMSLLSLFGRFCGFAFAAHMNMSELEFLEIWNFGASRKTTLSISHVV
jgi:hypothetical protein